MTNPIKLNEKSRTYFFPNDQTIILYDVVELIIRESGNHSLTTADGNLHVIIPGWLSIQIDEKNI